MLAVIISWITVLIVFLSFGDFLINLYNRLCKKDEEYGLTDTFLLGMCATLIPLSISSLWIPSNQYILFLYIALSIIYWIIRRKHLFLIVRKFRSSFGHLSILQLIAFIIPVLSLAIVILWQVGVVDSLFYHQQNIRWNEEFAAVPGLANLEHRFGFNSNYMLLSAIFSFRFIFGEGVYSLQALVLAFVICWIIKEIILSGYEIKRILLLIVFTGYIFIFGYTLASTSTDAIPNIVSFYLIAMLLLYPDSLKKKALLFTLVSISLLTFKLTIIPLCLFALYILISYLRKKDYKTATFLFLTSASIIVLWVIRNVIISGYLIFPFYEIDLFAVDWKVPKYVAIEERDFIRSCGIRIFNDIFWIFSIIEIGVTPIKDLISYGFTYICLIASVLIAPFITLYSFFRKKYLNKTVYFVYLVLMLILIIWYSGGPDPRFIGGALFANVYFVVFLFFSTKKEIRLRYIGIMVITGFTCIMGIWPIIRSERFYNMFRLGAPAENSRPISDILYKQYPYKELIKSSGTYIDKFEPYDLGNEITIYMSKSTDIPNGRYVCFDNPFPGSVFQLDDPLKYQDIKDISARGNNLQDGFKPKNR